MGRYFRIDRRYNRPFRPTGYTLRATFKWIGLVILCFAVNASLSAAHVGYLASVTTAALIGYAVYRIRLNLTPRLPAAPGLPPALATPLGLVPPRPFGSQWQFNSPPGWPPPPADWSPAPTWRPDPSWPPAPPGWPFWTQDPTAPRGAVAERNSRVIPQDVRIAVAVRDQGMCVQCGSREDLHYDHKIPWSRGGTNTVNNIQLLCGPCNRIKGADDIPV